MHVLVVIGHQRQGSFCHAIAAVAVEQLKAAGHEVTYHDLYAEQFDPILTEAELGKDAQLPPVIARHCDELMAADGYVVVHPNWWGQPPAILKGWVDRVIRQGTAYAFGPQGLIGHLAGRRAVVLTTSNTPRDAELQLFGDPLENLWKTCIFGFCGVSQFQRRNFESVIMSTPEQRREWLDDARRLIAEFFPVGAAR
jgi:putative NADPH-quinone reductase